MFVFDVTEIIDYKEYKNFIFSLKRNFDRKKEILFDLYNINNSAAWNDNPEKYIEFRDKYRLIRQNIIRMVIERFRKFLPKNCLIYEFGSLTKFTDRIESDVDLTFCYDETKNYIFESTEVLINYSIVYIFEHSINNIHGKFQHYPIMHSYNSLTEKDNLYILKFDQKYIEYKCGPEALIENIMGIKNVRDYRSLIDGYEEKYILKCNIDCLYSVIILENSTEYNFINDLSKLERKYDIFLNYSFNPYEYLPGNEVSIRDLKKAFKNTVVSLYIMISFLRKKVKWLDKYSMNIDDFFNSNDIMLFFGKEYIEKIKNSFIKMIFYWDRVELLLKKNNIILSTRCYVVLPKENLDKMLYKQYDEEHLIEKVSSSINELNNAVYYGWSIINEN